MSATSRARRAYVSPVPSFVFLPLILGALLLAAGTLHAESADPDDAGDEAQPDLATVEEEILVSASFVEVPREHLGSSVTVIDRDEIERRNKTTVLELLRTVPGVEISQSGGPGQVTGLFIRGGNTSHALVTLDGMRLNDNTTGLFDLADLTTDNLERIEVIRGPQGLIGGSEAVSGAVHIRTRRGTGPATAWARAAGGTDGYSRFQAGVRGGDERFDYSLSASRTRTDAVSAADEDAGNDEADPWQNVTVSSRLGGAVLGDGRADLTVRYTEGDADVDGFTFGVGPTDDLNGAQERSMLTAGVTVSKPITERWTQSLTVAGHRDELAGKDPDDVFSNFEINGRSTELKTQADLTLSESDTLSIGYREERRRAENVGSFDESLDIRSLYAENLWSWRDRLHVSLGVRNDEHSIFGDETTYRASVSARLTAVARLHGSFGTGFRAPTFNDLYFPGFGNPNLRPETSEGWDAGVELSFGDGRAVVDLTYFDLAFDDLILFAFPGGFVNVAEAESSGAELTFAWRPEDRLELRASHTFNDTEDLETGAPLARRPEHRTTLGVSFDLLEKLTGSAEVHAVRDRIDSDGTDMDDYERVDVAASYRLSERLRPFLRIENLLDADYSEIPGYTTPGLTAAVGLHLEF